jgi:hypothetical protein
MLRYLMCVDVDTQEKARPGVKCRELIRYLYLSEMTIE